MQFVLGRFRVVRALILIAALTALLHPLTARATTYTVNDLGVLTGNPSFKAVAINNAGQIAGDIGSQACLYSNGSLNDIGAAFGTLGSDATGLSSNGAVVGNCDGGIFFYENGTTTLLGNLGYTEIIPTGINSTNYICGGLQSGGSSYGFVYHGQKMKLLTNAGDLEVESTAINDRGDVTGNGPASTSYNHAFLYSMVSNVTTDLDGSDSYNSYPTAVNAYDTVVGYSDFGSFPFKAALFALGTGVVTGLGTYPTPYNYESEAQGINASGQIVGFMSDTFGDFHAFVYEGDTGVLDLNTLIPVNSGWTLLSATGINDGGDIIGSGINPQGQSAYFLLTPDIPEPAILGPTAICLIFFFSRRSCRRSRSARVCFSGAN